MNSDRWERVKSLFEEASGMPAERRQSFVAAKCGPDRELAREVEALLAGAADDGFLEKPALVYAAALFEPEGLPADFGDYRAVREIGRGGMAVVYLGERADATQVAIKLLRAGIYGTDVRRWFQRERQLLSELAHPNVVRLLDGGVTADGLPYLIQEYVDGPGITEFAAVRKLTIRQRLKLMQTVCVAVDYLHGCNIVHGDLKPANILVAAGGVPRIVDFGVARLISADGGGDLTLTRNRPLTPAYAAPEQVRGERAGARSDIYSLGIVLEELLKGDPPRAIAAAVRRATARDPERRWQSAGELAAELGRAARMRGQALDAVPRDQTTARRSTSRERWIAAVAALASVVVGGWWIVSSKPRIGEPDTASRTGLAVTQWIETDPRLSPDGGKVAYAVLDGPAPGIHVKPVTGKAVRITEPREGVDRFPDWSADGRRILFSRQSSSRIEIWTVQANGENPVKVREWVGEQLGQYRSVRWASFAPDDSIAVAEKLPGGPFAIFRYGRDGSRRQLTFPEAGGGDHEWAFVPGGERLIFIRFFTGSESDLFMTGTDGGAERRLTRHAARIYGLACSPDGRFVIYGGGMGGANLTLWRLPLEGAENAHALAQPVAAGNATWPSLAASPRGDGLRLVYSVSYEPVNLFQWSPPFQAGGVKALYPSMYHDAKAHLAPDGRRFVFTSRRSGNSELWLGNADGSEVRQLTDLRAGVRDSPRWSPDGQWIAFSSTDGTEARNVFVANAETGQVQRLTRSEHDEGRPSWSRDGRWIYFRSTASGRDEIWRMPSGGGEPRQITRSGAFEAYESADGKTLFFTRPRPALGVWSIAPEGGVERLVVPGPREGLWGVARDGIYWISTASWGNVMRYASGRTEQVAAIPDAGSRSLWTGFSVRVDGKAFLWSQSAAHHCDIVLADGLQ